MSVATLMVHLELGRPNTALLRITAALADRFHAGVIGIALCQPMRIIYNDGYIPPDIFDRDRKQIDNDMKAAEAEFRAALTGRAGTIEWHASVTTRSLSDYLADESCRADLVITGVDRNTSLFDTSHHVDMGDFVMQAGRPCLIVPSEAETLLLDHVVVGWKDSRETRRAISDALPLLQAAGRVTVVAIAGADEVEGMQTRLGDVAGWLKRHGIDAVTVTAASTGDDAARLDAIAGEQEATLLVAGAYGHSRVREWALGGVTRDLLLRAGRCALVSH